MPIRVTVNLLCLLVSGLLVSTASDSGWSNNRLQAASEPIEGSHWTPSYEPNGVLPFYSEDEVDLIRHVASFAYGLEQTPVGSIISPSGTRHYPAALGQIIAHFMSFDVDSLAEHVLAAEPLLSAVAADFRRNADLPANDTRRRYPESVLPTLDWPWNPPAWNSLSNCSKDYARFVDPVTNRIWSVVRSRLCQPPFPCTSVPPVPQVEQLKWGRRMIDAMGKIPQGLSEGTLYWIGSWDLCLDQKVTYQHYDDPENKTREFEGLYCRLSLLPSYSALANITGNRTIPLPLQLGVCVPDTCNKTGVHQYITQDNKLLKTVLYLLDRMTIPKIYCGIEGDSESDIAFKAAAGIMLVIVILVIIGTIYDSCFRKWRLRRYLNELSEFAELPHSQASTSVPQLNGELDKPATSMQKSPASKTSEERISSYELVEIAQQELRFVDRLEILLVGFSAYSNLRKIFTSRTKPDSISVLNGVRFCTYCWMIMGMSYFLGPLYHESYVTANTLAQLVKLPRLFKFQFIINFPVSGDSFLFISGFLVTYRFLKTNTDLEYVRRPLVLLSTIVKFILRRYWRYMPAMMLALMFHTCLSQYLATGPMFPIKIADAANCRVNWWVNLLLLNNMVRTEHLCQSWMFLVCLIFQLQLAAAIVVLIPLVINKKFGYIMIGVSWIAHIIATAILSHHFRHYDSGSLATGYLFTPWCRAGPFIIGMAFGIVIHHKNKIRMHWLAILACWIVSFGTLMAVVFSSYDEFREDGGGRWSPAAHAAYDTLARSAWGVALGWVVLACHYGYGGVVGPFLSWKLFLPLSRLVYPATVLHASMVFRPLYTGKALLYIEEYHMFYAMIGNVFYTVMVIGVIWTLLWHRPFSMGIEKFVLVRTKAEWLRFGRHPQTAKRPTKVAKPVKPFSGSSTYTVVYDEVDLAKFSPGYQSLVPETAGWTGSGDNDFSVQAGGEEKVNTTYESLENSY